MSSVTLLILGYIPKVVVHHNMRVWIEVNYTFDEIVYRSQLNGVSEVIAFLLKNRISSYTEHYYGL